MLRRKYPFGYELTPEALEKGTRWLTLWLKNIGNDSVHNMDIREPPSRFRQNEIYPRLPRPIIVAVSFSLV